MPGQGRAQFAALSLPSGSVFNEDISETTLIDADKLEHVHKPASSFALPIGGTPATREEVVFVASTAGVIRGFHCLLNDSGTSTNINFDLKVNGVSVLSSAVNVVHGDGDRTVKDGTISSAALSPDDVVSIAMTVTSATGAQGPFAWAEIQELAA